MEIREISGREAEMLRHRGLLEAVCEGEFPCPKDRFAGRGIVICGGGTKYLPSVYVLVRLLGHLRCRLPVEVWHLGDAEMPKEMRGLLTEQGVVCVDAEAVRRVHPVRRLAGWELKCYALMHSAFAEVLLLDADNCPVRNPEFLFTTAPYREHGAIFWPDYTRFAKGQAVWVASGIPYRDEPEFESGQIVVDKARCWRALNVAMHLNEQSDWWYRVVHGDKDTFHLAWRKIGQPYAMPEKGVKPLEATMLQHDFSGKLLFQHRNFAKWTLHENRRIRGFRLEEECLTFLAELRAQWTPGLPLWVRKWEPATVPKALRTLAARLCRAPLAYERAGLGARVLEFRPDGTIGTGAAGCERWWDLRLVKTTPGAAHTAQLEVFGEKGLTFRARPARSGTWKGAWVAFERCEVVLRPLRARKNGAEMGEFGRQEGGKRGKTAKKAVLDVRQRSQKVRKAVRDVSKRGGSHLEGVEDVPESQRSNREPIRDVPETQRNGRELNGDAPKREKNGRKAVGDVLEPKRDVREAVPNGVAAHRNDPHGIRDTSGRSRSDRGKVRDVADPNYAAAAAISVPLAKANGNANPGRKRTPQKMDGKISKR